MIVKMSDRELEAVNRIMRVQDGKVLAEWIGRCREASRDILECPRCSDNDLRVEQGEAIACKQILDCILGAGQELKNIAATPLRTEANPY